MHDPSSQSHHDTPKPSALDKYKRAIFLLAIVAISLLITLYLMRGSQYGQKGRTEETPSNLVFSATSTATTFTSPVSPLAPVSPVQTYPDPTSLDPLTAQSIGERGLQLYRSKNYTEALRLFNTVVDADPRDPRAYDMRGTIYTALNDYENALNDYSKAIELDASYAQAYYNRGRVYSLLKRYDAALSDLQKSSELDARNFGYRANGNIGSIYYQQGQYDKALQAFEISMSYDNTKADAFYLRGETYTALKNYQAAISDFEAAIARFPRYDLAYQSLGYVYYKTAQYDEAVEALNRATEISPNSPTARFYLGLVYLAQNDMGRAKTEISQGADSFTTLSKDDQQSVYTRITADLKAFAQKYPDKAPEVESMINQIPAP